MVAYSAFVERTEVCPIGTALSCFFAFLQQKLVLKDVVVNSIMVRKSFANHSLIQKLPFSLKFVRTFGIWTIKIDKTIYAKFPAVFIA